MKILNLYACLGGNRYLWSDEHEITSVEIDLELAEIYKERFPNDTMIVGDAHQYLLDNYYKYDFIWSSPPCPTHSRMRYNSSVNRKEGYPPEYIDMKLYQEIIFLDKFFQGKYCVENVIPYYTPLIPAQQRGRHLFWTNFILPHTLSTRDENYIVSSEYNKLCEFHKVKLDNYKGKNRKITIVRNMIDYEIGNTILNTAMGIIKKENVNQLQIF